MNVNILINNLLIDSGSTLAALLLSKWVAHHHHSSLARWARTKSHSRYTLRVTVICIWKCLNGKIDLKWKYRSSYHVIMRLNQIDFIIWLLKHKQLTILHSMYISTPFHHFREMIKRIRRSQFRSKSLFSIRDSSEKSFAPVFHHKFSLRWAQQTVRL